MQQEDLSKRHELLPSLEVQGINELDKRILKLQKMKSNRNAFTVIGAVLLILWLSGYFAAGAEASANPTSVATLIPILFSPVIIPGIILVALGVVGGRTARKRLDGAIKTRQVLVESLKPIK